MAVFPGARVTRWDRTNFLRALLGAVVVFGIAWVTTAATDEGGLSWGTRAGRALPVAPACAAFGTWLALRRRRREALGLQALGRPPQLLAAGAVAGGALFALALGALVAAASTIDVSGFFPEVVRADDIAFEDGRFVDHRRGIAFTAAGELEPILNKEDQERRATDRHNSGLPPGGRGAAGGVLGAAGLALCLLAACLEGSSPRRAALFGTLALAVVAATVILFHAAAARRSSAYLGLLPQVVLLGAAVTRYRGWGWSPRGTW